MHLKILMMAMILPAVSSAATINCTNSATGASIVLQYDDGRDHTYYEMNEALKSNLAAQGANALGRGVGSLSVVPQGFSFSEYSSVVTLSPENDGVRLKFQRATVGTINKVESANFYFNKGECGLVRK